MNGHICLLGPEAKKLYNDAQTMLKKIIENKSLKAHGVVAFYPANSTGDDIEVYDNNGEVIAVLHGLRQQVCLSVRSWTLIDTCWVLTCINGKNLVSTASPKCTHPITFLDL